jgi:CheY-like chemotaxis protein
MFCKLKQISAMQPYILMLQTDPDDRFITEEALAEVDISLPVKFVDSFDEFTSFTLLNGKPSLVLISEANTKYTSLDIVKKLRAENAYSYTPLIILTERPLAAYVSECYGAGANTVITKPSTIELTRKKVQTFFSYWLKVAELPRQTIVESN